MAKSVTGEYTFAIFAVTVIALVLSRWISVYFVPYLGTRLLRTPDHVRERKPGSDEYEQHDQPGLYDSACYNAFRKAVNGCVK